ncbi:hypothetical protein [Sphingomonas sp. CROZ-RG-20F-R02-07]|uniref:hypothetical protein n=1 Tax=Sphingomonas sp. CROZ-RG-20F-R02-07 TaxID=2914832 RepID=UPI001F598BE5|nr:hypothetical protein [Sphingomonas sp. CROZ-RG-20F-R02-07]
MTGHLQWNLIVDTVTDAMVRSHLARTPHVSIDAFVVQAIERELDRISLPAQQRSTVDPAASDDMWEIVIPRPR